MANETHGVMKEGIWMNKLSLETVEEI